METMATWLGGEHINALAKVVEKTIILIQLINGSNQVSMM